MAWFLFRKSKGLTYYQQLEDQPWAPWALLWAPSPLHSQQPYFPGFAFLHQRPDREWCKTPASCMHGTETSQGESNLSSRWWRSLLVFKLVQNFPTRTKKIIIIKKSLLAKKELQSWSQRSSRSPTSREHLFALPLMKRRWLQEFTSELLHHML